VEAVSEGQGLLVRGRLEAKGLWRGGRGWLRLEDGWRGKPRWRVSVAQAGEWTSSRRGEWRATVVGQ
jgi:hypothetical protein